MSLTPDKAAKEIKRLFGPSLDNILKAIRDQSKANTLGNNQIDTGFMKESNYHSIDYHGTTESSYDETWTNGSYPSGRKPGTLGDREKSPEIEPGNQAGLVATAADYALDQELIKSFLWQAVEDIKTKGIEGLVKKI